MRGKSGAYVPDWFLRDEENIADAVVSHVEAVRDGQDWVYRNGDELVNQYLGCDGARSGERYQYINPIEQWMQVQGKLKINLTASIVDTLTNRVTSRLIKPMILSSGGKWDNRLRAKKLEKYCTGVIYRDDAYAIFRKQFVDAGTRNIGYHMVATDAQRDRICIEYVPFHEVVVDEGQAARGAILDVFRVRDVPKHVLKLMFPDSEDLIDTSEEVHESRDGLKYDCGMVRMYQGWRVSVAGEPGIYVCCTRAGNLQPPTEWDHEFTPIVPMVWKNRPDHWVGIGAAEELYSMQREIDREVWRIQKNHDIFGDPTLLIDEASAVDEEAAIQSFTGKALKWSSAGGGSPPALVVNQSIHPEIQNWISFVANWAYQAYGVSQLSAQGVRQQGNDLSGFAFKVLEDIQNIRFANLEQAWQDLVCESAKRIIAFSKDLYGGRKHKVKYLAKNFIETVDWSEAVMDDDEFYVRVYPASVFPDTPSGRINTAQELLAAGLADPMEIRSEVFSPDMERMRELHDAPVDDIHMQIDEMLYRGEYSGPTKYQDLALGIRLVNSAYLRAKVDGAPPDRLAMCLQWLDEADEILATQQPEAPPIPPTADPSGPVPPQPSQQEDVTPVPETPMTGA
jgi:hypothetical protein